MKQFLSETVSFYSAGNQEASKRSPSQLSSKHTVVYDFVKLFSYLHMISVSASLIQLLYLTNSKNHILNHSSPASPLRYIEITQEQLNDIYVELNL